MNRDALIGFIWLAGALAVTGAALARRRLPRGRTTRLALVWLAIFAGGYVIAQLIGDRWNPA